MSYLERLKGTTNRKELADILGYKPSALASIVYLMPPTSKYTIFEIPKKSGGTRTIKAPDLKLKKLQTHLAHILYECLNEIEVERTAKPVSYGFRKNGRITDNARNHKRRRYVLNLDLADFFPSFNFGRVRGFFLKDKNFELAPEVATTIAQIACDGTALPQGSPCSPVISELVGQILDLRLLRIAKKYGVQYSRYADDITFSTNNKYFPDALAFQDGEDPKTWQLGEEIIKKINGSGFNINPNKTRMHCKGSRQMVTGLVVNDKVNIKSEYYRKSRAMCDSLFQTGKYYKECLPLTDTTETPTPNYITSLNPLEGILSHIYNVTQSEDRRETSQQRQEPRAIRQLYRRFLFYKYCVALDRPLVITEGKTDSIYLREAIKKVNNFHPKLGEPKDKGFEFKIRFFNYGGQAHEIMSLGGGTGDLKSIIMDYLQNFKPYKKRKPILHKPMKYPVIILLDNDDGLKDVAGTIKKNFSITIDLNTTDSFYHITENLYLVKTPEEGKSTCIEDLFSKSLLKTKLGEKTFSSKSKINPDTEYGKDYFAKHIVKKNAATIDFSGFTPLLKRINAVLDDYATKIS